MTSDLAGVFHFTFKFRFHLQSALALLSSAVVIHTSAISIWNLCKVSLDDVRKGYSLLWLQ